MLIKIKFPVLFYSRIYDRNNVGVLYRDVNGGTSSTPFSFNDEMSSNDSLCYRRSGREYQTLNPFLFHLMSFAF